MELSPKPSSFLIPMGIRIKSWEGRVGASGNWTLTTRLYESKMEHQAPGQATLGRTPQQAQRPGKCVFQGRHGHGRGVCLKDGKLHVVLPHTPQVGPASTPVGAEIDPTGPECLHPPSRQPREVKLSHRNKLALNFVQNSKRQTGGQHRKVTQASPVSFMAQ